MRLVTLGTGTVALSPSRVCSGYLVEAGSIRLLADCGSGVVHRLVEHGLDWSGISEPPLETPVQRVVLKQGNGPAVKASDTVTVNYLGETYKAMSPFESSFTSQPFTQPLSGLIPGWKTGLTGVKVGSRVLLQIPPAYAYGAQGSGAKIPPNATLWFVIDVVKAK